ELVTFAQFGTDDLDAATRRQLERGQRGVEILKQGQNAPLPVEQQVSILFALNEGYLDDIEIDSVINWEQAFHSYMTSNHSDVLKSILEEGDISSDTEESLKSAIDSFKQSGLAS
ncbi:MAG TPA: F0F1 ATP synthase subunit alpha, partial [Dehalococcoidia bacterium]|nr:F0F1 ATP synthase subunit alpha [Dehalococcoidia bacterium]